MADNPARRVLTEDEIDEIERLAMAAAKFAAEVRQALRGTVGPSVRLLRDDAASACRLLINIANALGDAQDDDEEYRSPQQCAEALAEYGTCGCERCLAQERGTIE